MLGVVCEYNPFHQGHAFHLRRSRELLGAEATLLCVMSGDFVQRGEAALFSKLTRAEAACRCGADLVIELPLPWSLSSAEGFAQGAVSLLAGLGAEYLSFGSEAGALEPLEELARTLTAKDLREAVRARLLAQPNLSYAAARQRVLEERIGPGAQLLEEPNNLLAVEYLRAIRELGLSLKPLTVRRVGAGHDRAGEPGARSASDLRAMLRRGEDILAELPPAAAEICRRELDAGRSPDPERLETALLSRLRMLDEAAFTSLPDGADGAGQRLYKAIREGERLEGILQAAKTKRYALARLRRLCLCAALGLGAEDKRGLPPYARVLAMNRRGQAHLAALRKRETPPILLKAAAVRALPESAQRLYALGAAAHDFYTLSYPCAAARKMGEDWRSRPALVEDA